MLQFVAGAFVIATVAVVVAAPAAVGAAAVVVVVVLLLLLLLLAARASAATRGGAISLLACAETRVLALCSSGIELVFCYRIGFCGVF